MKKLILIGLAISVMLPARAQLFGPESLSGAFWGSLIGGLVGGNRHHGFSGEGAAIGAGVGLLAGALASEANRHRGYYYVDEPYYSYSYSYGPTYSEPYLYYSPNRYCAPAYYYQPSRPNYAVSGTLFGAASGALIGASQDDAGRGAAIGAGAGLVLGSFTEHAARRQERRMATRTTHVSYQQTQPVQHTAPAAVQPHNPRQYQITSTPAPNSTYYWTAHPQIPDAPRVPDAPRF